MRRRVPRNRVIISYGVLFLAFVATAARAIFQLSGTVDVWYVAAAFALYFLTMILEPFLIARSLVYLHVINGLQTLIALILLLILHPYDFYALLLIAPCANSMLYFPRKTAYAWIGGICLVMVIALLYRFPLSESIGYVIIYPAAIALFTGFAYMTLQAEEAQARSEVLLLDLKKANQKLQAYAVRVQDLAAANERNRLARELHDSVTQTIFSLTLTAQSARILLDRDPARAAAQLDHLQTLAQNALTEMRSLIKELHPRTVAEGGLAEGLRHLVSERLSNDGLKVDLQVRGERRLPVEIEEGLFRITQEALNNIVKHAQVGSALVVLDLSDESHILMKIEDAGVGFDPARSRSSSGHLGLTSMAERIEALGGTLVVDSKPGMGTRIRVELDLVKEVDHA